MAKLDCYHERLTKKLNSTQQTKSKNPSCADPVKKEPMVAVIIVNYNGMQYIERCLDSVLSTDYPNFEVVFVDNASIDGSIAFVMKRFEFVRHLKIIVNDKNYGFAEGCNIGVMHVDPNSKYIVFLNIDTEVEHDWLKRLVNSMESDLTVGAAQCKLLQMYNRKRIDRAGYFLDFLGYGYSCGEGEEDKGQYDRTKEVSLADGAALAVRQSVVNEVLVDGVLFDPDYFGYHEEADLCWRIRLRGYKIIFIPTSIVYHVRGGISLQHNAQLHLVFHHTKNRITSLIKNYGLNNLSRYLPILVLLELARAVATLRWRGQNHSLAILKAFLWVIRNMRENWRKRLIVQHYVRKCSDLHVTKYMVRPNIMYLYHRLRTYTGPSSSGDAYPAMCTYERKHEIEVTKSLRLLDVKR